MDQGNNSQIRLKGFNISKESFENKYSLELTDIEWKVISSNVNASWEEHIQELRLLAFRHIKEAMHNSGFKIKLDGNDITFKRVIED